MATYDLSDLIGARTGFGLVKTHLENMRGGYKIPTGGSTSMASSSFASLLSTTISCVTTDIVLVLGTANLSSGTAARYAGLKIDLTGSGGGTWWTYFDTGLTTGDDTTATVFRLATGLSGTVTVDLQWKTGISATTIYSAQSALYILKLKDGGAL